MVQRETHSNSVSVHVVGKAFVVATMMVFGGATVVFLLTAHKLQLHSVSQ